MENTYKKKKMKVLLDALTFYKDIAGAINWDELEIIDEQIGALRANLFGEENGWRSKEGQIAYEKRKVEEHEKLLQELIKMVDADKKEKL